MGYCYTQDRRTGRRVLVCDVCSSPGATKHACTFGYCPATAACPACWARIRGEQRAYHLEHCKPAAEAFAAKEARKAAALGAGAYVFCAALNVGEAVQLTYRGASGATVETVSPRATYDYVRSLDVATLDDARRFEEVGSRA